MPCDDCPQQHIGERIVTVGLKPGGAMRFATDGLVHEYVPTVSDDGTLVYNKTPRCLEGYRLSGAKLVPLWPPCRWRVWSILQADDGQLDVTCTCLDPRAVEDPTALLTLQHCTNCQNKGH